MENNCFIIDTVSGEVKHIHEYPCFCNEPMQKWTEDLGRVLCHKGNTRYFSYSLKRELTSEEVHQLEEET